MKEKTDYFDYYNAIKWRINVEEEVREDGKK